MSYNFDDYKINGEDTAGRTIERILDHCENKYIVYFVKKQYLTPVFSDSEEFKINLTSEFEDCMSQIDQLPLKDKKKYSFVRVGIAEALKLELRDNHEAANRELQLLIQKIKAVKESEEFWTYFVVFSIATLVLSVLVFIDVNTIVLNKELATCILFSSLGSMLFNLQNQRKHRDSLVINVLQIAVLDFVKSAISGILIYIIINSNIILGNFSENTLAILVIAFISGYNDDIPLKIIEKIKKIIVL